MSTKNKEIKEITDIDLDTGTNLVTENYQLEILGLKDLVDLRKFSRSFLKVDKLLKSIFTGKEDKIDKKSAFNKEFGVAQNEVLEGSKLAEILGIEYGGVLNNTNAKIAGKGYYDIANKKIYKCTANTSINYADAGYFIEVSNNDLLGKLQNLYAKGITDKTFQTSYGTLVVYERIIGIIKFFIFELNINTINSGLNTFSLSKIEEVTGMNIYDYTFEVNSSYNADVTINVQYQNNTMRINSKNTKPEGNAFIIRGFSRLTYTN